jgi:hypothetical protein
MKKGQLRKFPGNFRNVHRKFRNFPGWGQESLSYIYIEEVERKRLGRGVGLQLPAVSFS